MIEKNPGYLKWRRAKKWKRFFTASLVILGIGGGIGIGYGIWHNVDDTYLSVKYDVMFFKWDAAENSSLPIVKGNSSNKIATNNLNFKFSKPAEKPNWLEINKNNGQLIVPTNGQTAESDANKWFTVPIDVEGKIENNGKLLKGHYDVKIHVSDKIPCLLTDFFDAPLRPGEDLNFMKHNLHFSGSGYNGRGEYYSIPLYTASDPEGQTPDTQIASINKCKDNSSKHFYRLKFKNASTGEWSSYDFAHGADGEAWNGDTFSFRDSPYTSGYTYLCPSMNEPFRDYYDNTKIFDIKTVWNDDGPFDQTIFYEGATESQQEVPSILNTEQIVNKVPNNIYIPTKTKESD